MEWVENPKGSDSWYLMEGDEVNAHVGANKPFFPDETNGNIHTFDGGVYSWHFGSIADGKQFLEWALEQNRTYVEWMEVSDVA